ncbi:endonuclease/exonuclease/phosphatase family protein [Candidatus Palauibacter sp.]|uniref:endonuclease/exonuclease/phosphatase family protein n=1 Tax=Candidatus Palauibacter sp. TaxID=3101350 RepID=UPI003CC6AC0F
MKDQKPAGLSFDSDERRTNPGDSGRRRARFKIGWQKAVRGVNYGERALRRLTWDNLGWRLGKLLGPASAETVERMYQLCVKQQAETALRIRVVSWNLKYPGTRRAGRIAELEWDLLLLQEVTRKAADSLKAEVAPSSSAFGIDWLSAPHGRAHGAAILTRGGFAIAEAESLLDLPMRERGVGAVIRGPGGVEFRAVSWHAPNAAGQGVEFKMTGYTGIISYLERLTGPVILGFDANHWNLGTGLEPHSPPRPGSSAWYLEELFFSNEPPHGLRDAYLDYLIRNPAEYARVLAERPDGPLAVTYVRGSKSRPQPDRFDYVFVSDHFSVYGFAHDYEASVEAGSDHATVHADLRLNLSKG